jgi:thiamine kinase-like enzyme
MGQRRKEEEVLTSLDGVTPEWLTGRLRVSGCLQVGQVTSVEHRRIFSNNATSAVIAIDYSAETNLKEAPRSLFVKVANPGVPWNRVEFDFYTTIVPEMQRERPDIAWPIPYAYDAAYSEDESGAYLLLEDLSLSHVAADTPVPPTPTEAQQVVEGLAAIHAYWWQDERLGNEVGQRQTAETLQEMIQWARGNFAKWSVYVGERLSPDRRKLLELIFQDWPALRKQRVLEGKGLTLVHRDTHPLNFLYPRQEGTGGVKIVDWQSWRVDSGMDDLAYMMACHWYPEYRHRLERPLLEHYHQQLLAHGVRDYDWELCWYDYRASVVRCIFFLVGGWDERRPATMWWERLEKGLLAFEDLGCQDLMA